MRPYRRNIKLAPNLKAILLGSLTVFCGGSHFAFSAIANAVVTAESANLIDPPPGAVPGDSPNDTVTLGTAYHSKKNGFYGLHSVKGVIDQTYGNTRSEIFIGVDLGYKEVLDMVSGNVEASLNIPAIRAGVGANYAKDVAADEYTSSYTIYFSVKPKKKILVPASDNGYEVTDVALELVQEFPGNKFNEVGDEFVHAIEYGSFLIINLNLEYKNSKDKRKIGGHLNVDWAGGVEVSGALSLLDEEVKKSVKISVSALQGGGNANELTDIIPDGLMLCSLNSPAPCFKLFENSVAYLKNTYIKQFTSLDKYNVVNLYTRRYDESGANLMALVPEIYEEISFLSKLAKKSMTDNWVESLLDKRRADNILTYYTENLDDQTKLDIEMIVHKAYSNAFLYAHTVNNCNQNPNGNFCARAQQDAEPYIELYDRSILNLAAE